MILNFIVCNWPACRSIYDFFLTRIITLQLDACAHPFFDELREPNARLPNGRPLPPLFNFKQEVCTFEVHFDREILYFLCINLCV